MVNVDCIGLAHFRLVIRDGVRVTAIFGRTRRRPKEVCRPERPAHVRRQGYPQVWRRSTGTGEDARAGLGAAVGSGDTGTGVTGPVDRATDLILI